MRYEQLSVGELEVDTVIGGAGSSSWRNTYYLNAALGSDGNTGKSFSQPLKTWATAKAKLETLKKDRIILEESASAVSVGSTFTFDKSLCGLMGTAQNNTSQRSRIGMSTTFTPFVSITGYGNQFKNLYFQHGTASTDLVGFSMTGNYNYYENVHFAGPMAAAQSTTGYVGSQITSTGNYYKGCVFGNNTCALNGAYPVVQMSVPSNSYCYNVFEDCTFLAFISATTPVFFNVTNTVGEVYAEFKNCRFIATSSNMLTKMATAFTFTAGYTAAMIIQPDCQFTGVTALGTTAGGAFIHVPVSAFPAATDHVALIANALTI